MRNDCCKKALVIGIIVLFIGMSITPSTGNIMFFDDNTPPVTTISFDPPEPDGYGGWYVSDVTVTLNATDDMSGVNATYYRIEYGEWETYDSPFVISEDGDDILIEYYSVDNLGNVEDVKSATLDIDQTPPEIIIDINVTKIGCKKWWLLFTFTVTDNTSGCGGGGMVRIEIFINGVWQDTVMGHGPTYRWGFTYGGGLKITVGAGASDNAGNYGYNETELNSLTYDIHTTQQLNHLWFLRFFDRFPLLERLLNLI